MKTKPKNRNTTASRRTSTASRRTRTANQTDGVNEPRAYGEWEPKVKVYSDGNVHSTLRRKVVTEGIAFVKIPFDRIVDHLRKGNEVVLGDESHESGIRLFPCLNKELSEMFVAAQTVGDFRHSIGDLKFTVRHRGLKASKDDCERMVSEVYERHEKQKRDSITVCPTRHVTCPNCGADLELGPLMANKE